MHFTRGKDELWTVGCLYKRRTNHTQLSQRSRVKSQRKPGMVKGLILTGLLVLLCHEVTIQAHVLTRHNSANVGSKLKSLMQQLVEALGEEDNGALDYEDRNMAPSQSQASPVWEKNKEEQTPTGEETSPEEDLELQKRHLMDLLLSTRSKGFSGCFGGRLDRIGSSSSLGCNSMRG